MPNIVINELSAISQASDLFAVDALMRGLAQALHAVKQASGANDFTVYKHCDLANRDLCSGPNKLTVHGWLSKNPTRELKVSRDLLLRLLTKSPYLDTVLPDTPHVCYHIFRGESTNHPFSGLACAAHLRVALLSFADCARFPKGLVSVRYGSSEQDAVTSDLQHFLDEHDVDRARRKYEPHEKHTGGPMHGSRGTPMDLSDIDAQTALDQCVAVSGEKRVCSRFRGKIYVFLPHRAEENRYHGFPMDESEVYEKMPKLYRLLPPAN